MDKFHLLYLLSILTVFNYTLELCFSSPLNSLIGFIIKE